jgi:hypothetical protein
MTATARIETRSVLYQRWAPQTSFGILPLEQSTQLS